MSLALVLYQRVGAQWPSAPTAACIAANAVCEIAQATLPITQIINLPLRFWALREQQSKNKMYFHMAATMALVVPYGRFISMALDAASEYQAQESSHKFEIQTIDATIAANALTILDLKEEEAKDPNIIRNKRNTIVQTLSKRLDGASPIIRESLFKMIQDVETASATLLSHT